MRPLSLLALILFFPSQLSAQLPLNGDPKLELTLQKGHSDDVISVNWSPDGKHVATGSADKTAIIWNASTGSQVMTLVGHSSLIWSVSWSPDGKQLATGSRDNSAIIWDVCTGQKIHLLEGHASVVGNVRWSPDGKYVATCSWDRTAIIWDAFIGKKLQTLKGHTDVVKNVSWSPDGKNLATSASDNKAIIWETLTGKQLKSIEGHPTESICVEFSPDGKRIVLAGEKSLKPSEVKILDRINNQELLTLQGHTRRVRSITFSPDGKRLATSADDNSTIIWDASSGKRLQTLNINHGHSASVSWSPNGRYLLATESQENMAIIWDTTTGRQIQRLKGRAKAVNSVAFSPDGKELIIASADDTAIVWKPSSGKVMHKLIGNTQAINSIVFSPDGKWIVSASGNFLTPGELNIWDSATGRKVRTLQGHAKQVNSVSYSPDGKYLATGSSDETPIIWDANTGRQIKALKGHSDSIHSVSWSPDGKHLATSSTDGTTIIWHAATGKEVMRLIGHFLGVLSVSWSPDGKKVATGGADNTVFIWDPFVVKKTLTLTGHSRPVVCVSWSPNGKYLASGSMDSTVIIRDASTGKQLMKLKGHADKITSLNWSLNSKFLATGSEDATTRIWNIDTGKEFAKLVSMDGGAEWLVTTPDGYFDGSANASQFVEYRVKDTLNLVPLENYRKQFERPGLLDKIFKGENYRGNNTIVQDPPPKVRITSPTTDHTSDDGTFTITAEAESRGNYPVQQFRLLINGRPYPIGLGVVRVNNPQRGKVTAKWTIKLGPGKHSVEVLAYTQAVFASSDGIQIKYLGGGVKPIELPCLYIFAVGVSKYNDSNITDLDFAHRDAEEVAKAFQLHSKTLFRKMEVKVLTNEKATRDNIMDGLDWLRRSATHKDFSVFFFAGHGQMDERNSVYFLPVDTKVDRLARSAIDGDVLSKELESTVGQLTVILDACHSGAIGGNKHRGLTDILLRDLTSEEKGIAMLCATKHREKAQESPRHQHGVFTQALLEALRGTGNGETGERAMTVRLFEGAVYFKQLDSYISDRVKQLTKGRQHPMIKIPRSFPDFPLSKP